MTTARACPFCVITTGLRLSFTVLTSSAECVFMYVIGLTLDAFMVLNIAPNSVRCTWQAECLPHLTAAPSTVETARRPGSRRLPDTRGSSRRAPIGTRAPRPRSSFAAKARAPARRTRRIPETGCASAAARAELRADRCTGTPPRTARPGRRYARPSPGPPPPAACPDRADCAYTRRVRLWPTSGFSPGDRRPTRAPPAPSAKPAGRRRATAYPDSKTRQTRPPARSRTVRAGGRRNPRRAWEKAVSSQTIRRMGSPRKLRLQRFEHRIGRHRAHAGIDLVPPLVRRDGVGAAQHRNAAAVRAGLRRIGGPKDCHSGPAQRGCHMQRSAIHPHYRGGATGRVDKAFDRRQMQHLVRHTRQRLPLARRTVQHQRDTGLAAQALR